MKILGEFSSTDLTEDTEDEADDVVVIAVEVDPYPVSGHHQQF